MFKKQSEKFKPERIIKDFPKEGEYFIIYSTDYRIIDSQDVNYPPHRVVLFKDKRDDMYKTAIMIRPLYFRGDKLYVSNSEEFAVVSNDKFFRLNIFDNEKKALEDFIKRNQESKERILKLSTNPNKKDYVSGLVYQRVYNVPKEEKEI